MDHQTKRAVVIGVVGAAVAFAGVSLIKERYFAAAFAILCVIVAELVEGA